MAIIGNIDIGLRVFTGPMGKALAKGATLAKGFAAKAVNRFRMVGSALAQIGKGATGFDKLKSAILGAAAGLTAFALAGKAKDLGIASAEKIGEMSKFAREVGSTTESLSELEFAASNVGVGTDRLRGALAALSGNLVEARVDGGAAATAIGAMGLDLDQLAAMDPAKAVREIAAAISKLPTDADKAIAATRLFGEAGRDLLPLLEKGGEGVDALAARAKELGVSIASTDAAKVNQAGIAIDQIGKVIDTIGQQVAIQLAPLVTALAEQFAAWGGEGSSAAGLVTTALEWVAKAVGFVADVANGLKIAWLAIWAGMAKVVELVIDAIAYVVRQLEAWINKIPGVQVEWSKAMDEIAAAARSVADDQIESLFKAIDQEPPSAKINRFFDDVRKGADRAAAASAKAARQINSIGGAGKGINLNEAAKKKLIDEGNAVRDSLLSPIEQFEKEAKKLETLLDAGTIDRGTFARGLEKARKDAGLNDYQKRAGALELGSQEARSSVLNFQRMNETADPIRDVARNSRDTVAELRRQTTLQQRLFDRLTARPAETSLSLP